MYELTYQEINKKDQIVTKRKSFKTEEEMQKFIEKISEKDNFCGILCYS